MNYINFTAKQMVELKFEEVSSLVLGPNEVSGKTLVSLVSPGTEINYHYYGEKFPSRSGYAVIFEIDKIGTEVTEFQKGDRVFSMGNHCSSQLSNTQSIMKVPDSISSERAVLTRLMMVSCTSLMKTQTRPGDHAWIGGYGPVGYLAAAQFRNAGYQVTVVEIDDKRRLLAEKDGYIAYKHCPVDDVRLKGTIDIYMDCSGHESSVLAGCKMVRREGEVILVGVPWEKKSNIDAHAILWEVFHNYVHLQSGWEWSLPAHIDSNNTHSIWRNAQKCLEWLQNEHLINEDLIGIYKPTDCQRVYDGLAQQTLDDLFILFDWTEEA